MANFCLRWGIIGAGNIANDFSIALKTLPSESHRLVAIGSRSLEKAEKFANLFNIPKFYGSYQDLLDDDEIDIVYVATVNHTHKPVVLQAVEAGKHVLCEKPLAVNVREAQEMIQHAREKQVFLMEAMWSTFLPSWKELKLQVKQGTIGEPRFLSVIHGRQIYSLRARFYDRNLAGGMLCNLGMYPLVLIHLLYGDDEPEKITASGFNFETGVDKTSTVTFSYTDGKIAQFTTSCDFDYTNGAAIVGDKGTLHIHEPYWCSTRLETPKEILEFQLPDSDMPSKFANATGLGYEIDHVRHCLIAGKLESDVQSHHATLRVLRWMDEIRKQIGVSFEQDEVYR